MSDLLNAKKLFEKGIKEFNDNNYMLPTQLGATISRHQALTHNKTL